MAYRGEIIIRSGISDEPACIKYVSDDWIRQELSTVVETSPATARIEVSADRSYMKDSFGIPGQRTHRQPSGVHGTNDGRDVDDFGHPPLSSSPPSLVGGVQHGSCLSISVIST